MPPIDLYDIGNNLNLNTSHVLHMFLPAAETPYPEMLPHLIHVALHCYLLKIVSYRYLSITLNQKVLIDQSVPIPVLDYTMICSH